MEGWREGGREPELRSGPFLPRSLPLSLPSLPFPLPPSPPSLPPLPPSLPSRAKLGNRLVIYMYIYIILLGTQDLVQHSPAYKRLAGYPGSSGGEGERGGGGWREGGREGGGGGISYMHCHGRLNRLALGPRL